MTVVVEKSDLWDGHVFVAHGTDREFAIGDEDEFFDGHQGGNEAASVPDSIFVTVQNFAPNYYGDMVKLTYRFIDPLADPNNPFDETTAGPRYVEREFSLAEVQAEEERIRVEEEEERLAAEAEEEERRIREAEEAA